ncbi:YdcF family protein [Chitinophaga filiformis]|uniref:YdcF family protein n=1 Tax=Chitinophaga filiformis TaxID=104663 RepID=A0ABY4IDL0_CHIFI|nr:YdcF family protein [Chitinophaga filiformis]UPK72736.1 YdcF family protein [Chitinophaga filiformis]
MQDEKTFQLAQKLWDYLCLHQDIKVSDCILVLGSHDTSVAERAADIFLEGFAPLVVFSGGFGYLTQDSWKVSEAETFAEIAIKKGVPESAIILERKSTNTGENVIFSMQLLKERHISPSSFILVHKPYMERRTYATFRNHFKEVPITVTSPQISMSDYLSRGTISYETFLDTLAGDLYRIKTYSSKGFQIPQEIPEDVWKAYTELVALGFDKRIN